MEDHTDSPNPEEKERLKRLKEHPDYQAIKRLAGKSIGNIEHLLPEEEGETKSPSPSKDIAEALRELLRKDGAPSRYQVWRASGVDQGALSRFFNGGGLKLGTAVKIAGALGYELRLVKSPKPRQGP